MKLAYSSNAYMKCSIEQTIERIAGLGFGAMELMADQPHAWPATTTDEQIASIRKCLDVYGLQLSNINAFMMNAVQDFWHPSWIEPDKDFRRLRIEHTKSSLTLANKLGAKCITTEPGGPLPEEMSRAQAMDIFTVGLIEVLSHAEDMDVQLLIEPEPELLVENAEQFFELSQRVNSPMFGLNFDIGHFYCVGDDLPETIVKLQHLTRHYHFEDIAATRVHEHLIPGRGAIDFSAVLNAIRETKYADWLTIELYPYLDDPDGAGKEARDYLLQWMKS